MTKKTILLIFLLAVLAFGALLSGCALREFGQVPEDISVYEHLPYFAEGEFRNQQETPYYPGRSGAKHGVLRFILNSNAPDSPLPMDEIGTDAFAAPPDDLAVYWLGHASLILELEGKRFLVDPVFDNAAPIPFVVRRYGPAPIEREALPLPDYILLTHDHYDHLEYATISHFKDADTQFIVPLGVGAHLRKWGVPPEKIHELGWGDARDAANIRITAERAQHFSGRTWSTRNRSLWASYVLQGAHKRVFIAGDGGYGEHFRAIGEQYGPFDLAFFEIDAWNDAWPNTHLFPKEVIQASHDVRATNLVPVHWGTFDLAVHPWDESIRMIAELVDEDGTITLLTPRMGEKLVPGTSRTVRWWEGMPDE